MSARDKLQEASAVLQDCAETIGEATAIIVVLHAALTELEAAVADGLCNSGLPDFDADRLDRALAAARGALAIDRGEPSNV